MIRKQKEVAQMIVGFVGAGNMAGAIIRGMAAGGFRGENIWVYDPDEEKLSALYADCGVTICPSAESVASGVDTLVLAVKPQVLPAVLPALTGVRTGAARWWYPSRRARIWRLSKRWRGRISPLCG